MKLDNRHGRHYKKRGQKCRIDDDKGGNKGIEIDGKNIPSNNIYSHFQISTNV